MRIQSKPFGEVEVDQKQHLTLPWGLFGFESLHDYALLDASQPPFYWLQSLERVTVAFVLVDPRVFLPEYALDVDEQELEELGGGSPSELLDFVIVTIPSDPREMTANLQGPLVVNRRTRTGRQCISRNPQYPVRHRILDSLAAVRE